MTNDHLIKPLIMDFLDMSIDYVDGNDKDSRELREIRMRLWEGNYLYKDGVL